MNVDIDMPLLYRLTKRYTDGIPTYQNSAVTIDEIISETILYLLENKLDVSIENYKKYLKKGCNRLILDEEKSKPEIYKARQERHAQWQKDHPDKVKAYQYKWNEKNKERKSAKEKELRESKKKQQSNGIDIETLKMFHSMLGR